MANYRKRDAKGRLLPKPPQTAAEFVADLEAADAKKTAKQEKPKDPEPTAEEIIAGTEFEVDGEVIDIWQRRMKNPQMREAKPIRLKIPGMHLRWINCVNNGRYQRARFEEGWVNVQRDELVDEREIFGATFTPQGYVCRGERQAEMLMRMPEAVFKKIQEAKYEMVRKSRKNLKGAMQSAGAKHFGEKYNNNKGDEIASKLDEFKGSINFGDDPGEAPDLSTANLEPLAE